MVGWLVGWLWCGEGRGEKRVRETDLLTEMPFFPNSNIGVWGGLETFGFLARNSTISNHTSNIQMCWALLWAKYAKSSVQKHE